VKLVPVLLVSSAFVQMMIVETELPQVVSQAIQKQEDQKNVVNIALEVNQKEGIRIITTEKGQEKVDIVPMKDGQFDYPALHQHLVEAKKVHPEIFKIELSPDAKVAYKEIVKIMDEARQSRDSNVKFPVYDQKQGKEVQTPYMFPEVVFANTMEG
jgi:biopolymer transport protein ExbD